MKKVKETFITPNKIMETRISKIYIYREACESKMDFIVLKLE